MGSEVWPTTLRIYPGSFERGPDCDTTVQRARDGSELRIDWGRSGWHYNFTVRTVDVSQRAALETFFAARKGRWDSFFFTDPVDSVQRLVRFNQDSLSGQYLGPDVYEYGIELVTVVA